MEPGEVIAGRYRLVRKLGEGGMGAVFEAEHTVTGRRVAVKVLERRDKVPVEAVDRFFREASAPTKIGHPNVVEVFDAGTEPDGTAFIAMELLEGEGLDEVLRRERVIQPERLSAIVGPLLDGLDAMHARGYVHRDLKPANIFLAYGSDGSMRVKILDFGIAKALGEDSRTRSGYVIGTPAYMAPEQMRNARGATPLSDLWSIGVILYEALAGHRPFRGETFGILAQVSGPQGHVALADAAPYLPAVLTGLVDELLAKDPALRPTSARTVRDRLTAALAGCPPVHPVVPPDIDGAEPDAGAPPEGPPSDPAQAPWHVAVGLQAHAQDDDRPPPTDASLAIPLAKPRTLSGRPAWLSAVVVGLVGGILALAFRLGSGGGHVQHAGSDAGVRSSGFDRHPDVLARLQQWMGTITATQGHGSISGFYTDPASFGGVSMHPIFIQRAWAYAFSEGGGFNIDWRATAVDEVEPALGGDISALCVNAAGATGRVVRVQGVAEVSCGTARREPYIVLLRRIAGELRICQEGWVDRRLCSSCPSAPGCVRH